MLDILVPVEAGFFGSAGFGLLSGAIGALFWRSGGAAFPAAKKSLIVLIPACQEETKLAATVESIREAAAAGGIALQVFVGADSCTDRTEAIASAAGTEVIVFSHRSKWKTLRALFVRSQPGDWVALVDAGALWPRELLQDLAVPLADPGLLGIAPAYFPCNASRLERGLWALEANWKCWENRAGGPVSVHGATVFFRGEVLAGVFSYLDKIAFDTWLNDDIAIPFAARILYPRARLLYWCPQDIRRRISDSGLHEEGPQWGRRRRMMVGNFQWILGLWPRALFASPFAALLALRRIGRIFWAYWFFCFLYAFCFFFLRERLTALLVSYFTALFGAAVLWGAGKRGIVETALISFLSPFFLPFIRSPRAQRWG